MRLIEFLTEAELEDHASAVMPLAYSFPSMPSSDPYQILRFGIEMASDGAAPSSAPARQGAVVIAYAPEEEAKIKRASKQSGHAGKILAKGGSHEPADTHKISPVAKPKKNRYGV